MVLLSIRVCEIIHFEVDSFRMSDKYNKIVEIFMFWYVKFLLIKKPVYVYYDQDMPMDKRFAIK